MWYASSRYDLCMSTLVDQHANVSTNPLLPIFAHKRSDALATYCQGPEVTAKDLIDLVLRARLGRLQPYNYACHVLDATPAEIGVSVDDLNMLPRNPPG
jgi:hypothetical protein